VVRCRNNNVQCRMTDEGEGAEPPDAGGKGGLGAEPPAVGDFHNFLIKITHF